MSKQSTNNPVKLIVLLVALITLIIILAGSYQALVRAPAQDKHAQSVDKPAWKPNEEVVVAGVVGITNCESAGAECNTVSLTDTNGKQWNLVLTDEQNSQIKTLKRIKVRGEVTQSANKHTIKVSSYESL